MRLESKSAKTPAGAPKNLFPKSFTSATVALTFGSFFRRAGRTGPALREQPRKLSGYAALLRSRLAGLARQVSHIPLPAGPAGASRFAGQLQHGVNTHCTRRVFRLILSITREFQRPFNNRASAIDRKSTRLNSSHANISYA